MLLKRITGRLAQPKDVMNSPGYTEIGKKLHKLHIKITAIDKETVLNLCGSSSMWGHCKKFHLLITLENLNLSQMIRFADDCETKLVLMLIIVNRNLMVCELGKNTL